MRGHRRELLIRRGDTEWFTQALWDENDDLMVAAAEFQFRAHEQTDGGIAARALLDQMEVAGLEVECCAHCRHFVYAGMGADTGSSIGSCSEGKTERQFRRTDDTAMTDWCEAFHRQA